LCFWYPQATQVPAVELEPHGPRNIIKPGATASFTEDWYLVSHPFPAQAGNLTWTSWPRKSNAMRDDS